MANIELVIKIPDEDYKTICEKYDTFPTELKKWGLEAIKDGTPLPKEHGRLIDADVFEKRLMIARLYYIGETADNFDLLFAAGLKSAAERLVDAPTIIDNHRSR